MLNLLSPTSSPLSAVILLGPRPCTQNMGFFAERRGGGSHGEAGVSLGARDLQRDGGRRHRHAQRPAPRRHQQDEGGRQNAVRDQRLRRHAQVR